MDITDINAIAPGTSAKAAQASISLADNFQTFLTLLTTQLQQQDPLDPLDTNEFTNQLVSFTQVEQSIRSNQNLEDILAALTSDNFNSLVGFLGKDVTLDTNQTGLVGGRAEWQYALESTADEVTIQVKDAAGRVVFETEGDTAQGDHSFVWDGRDAFGNSLPEGPYSISVTASTAGGNQVGTTTSVKGRVDSVETEAGVNTLRVNGISVPLGTVIKISEPALENA